MLPLQDVLGTNRAEFKPIMPLTSEAQWTAGRGIFILDVIRQPSVRHSESARLQGSMSASYLKLEGWEEHPL